VSPTGHKFTAAALGVALSAPLIANELMMEAAMCFAGVMFGARVPDWSEVAKWVDGKRYSLIPHRGPTHWPGTWIIGLIISAMYLESPFREPLIGFFSAAILHLVMDIMTPTGIPLLHPFSRNVSIKTYRSGSLLPETGLTILCWTIALATIPIFSTLDAAVFERFLA